MGEWPGKGAVRTNTMFINFAVLNGGSSWCPQITQRLLSQIIMTDIIDKKIEIVSELPKYDTKTQSKQILEKCHQWTCLTQGSHGFSMCKNVTSNKGNQAKHMKAR